MYRHGWIPWSSSVNQSKLFFTSSFKFHPLARLLSVFIHFSHARTTPLFCYLFLFSRAQKTNAVKWSLIHGAGNYLANTKRRTNGDIFGLCFLELKLNGFCFPSEENDECCCYCCCCWLRVFWMSEWMAISMCLCIYVFIYIVCAVYSLYIIYMFCI